MSIDTTSDSTSYLNETRTARRTITQHDVDAFCQLSGDYNPVHFDVEYAAATRFDTPIIHGAFLTSLVSAALAKFPGIVVLVDQKMRFKQPAYPGSTYTAEAVIDGELSNGMLAVRTTVTDELGTVYATGDAKLLLDRATTTN